MNEVGYKVIVAKHCDGHDNYFHANYDIIQEQIYMYIHCMSVLCARLLEMYSK